MPTFQEPSESSLHTLTEATDPKGEVCVGIHKSYVWNSDRSFPGWRLLIGNAIYFETGCHKFQALP